MIVLYLAAAAVVTANAGQTQDRFAQWLSWKSLAATNPMAVEQRLYLRMQMGQWEQARLLIEQRKAIGNSTVWLETCEGDLLFAEGSISQAKIQYQNAAARVGEPDERRRLENRIAATEKELQYQESVRLRSACARWLGFGAVALLLGLPFLLPALWKRKGPGFPGPR